jgi:hypothetical protein
LVGLRGGQDLITHLVGISSIEDLPKLDRFQQLLSEEKHFIDTIKLVAYRPKQPLRSLPARRSNASMMSAP